MKVIKVCGFLECNMSVEDARSSIWQVYERDGFLGTLRFDLATVTEELIGAGW